MAETFNHAYGENGPTEDLQVKLETVHEQWKITHWDPMPEGLSMQEQKERNFQLFIKDYLRCVASVDDNVGRLLEFDVNNDPLEINDLYADPAYAGIAADMKALLAQKRANVGLTDALEARIFNGEGGVEARQEIQAIPGRVTENTQRLAQHT